LNLGAAKVGSAKLDIPGCPFVLEELREVIVYNVTAAPSPEKSWL
jgi:hypothetical protein